MIKLLLTLFLCFSFNACSPLMSPRIVAKTKGVDEKLQIYVDSYKLVLLDLTPYEHKFKNLSMNFSKLEGKIIGTCYWLLDGGLEIEIDTEYWNRGNELERIFLIYHELEHCVRDRLHTNKKETIENVLDFFDEIAQHLGLITKKGYLADGCPSSLMHSYAMDYSCRERHFLYYIMEIRYYKR